MTAERSPAGSIAIRRGAPDEAALLTRIARAAKSHWGYPDAWMQAWGSALTLTEADIARWVVGVAIPGDGPDAAGFYALDTRRPDAELEHLWVAPERMARGVGRALFLDAVEEAARAGCARLCLDADPNAEGFYLRLGARRIGEARSDVVGVWRSIPRLAVALAGGPIAGPR